MYYTGGSGISGIPLGWLAPDGTFYETEWMEHLAKASELCEEIYGEEVWHLPDDYLMDRGWVHVTETHLYGVKVMVMWHFSNHLTNAQKDYLRPYIEDMWHIFDSTCKYDLAEEFDIEYSREENDRDFQAEMAKAEFLSKWMQ